MNFSNLFRVAFGLIAGFTIIFSGGKANAAATLIMSSPFLGGIASNFANSSGTPVNGMPYGIIVTTGNSSFSTGSYDPISATVLQNGGFLQINGVNTDDYFHPGGNPASAGSGLTYNSTGDMEGNFSTPGSSGTIGNIISVPVDPTNPSSPVAQGNLFGLIWFPSLTANAGSSYGFFTHGSFILPGSGQVDYSSVFAGTDPIRSASFQFAAVPEPGKALLLVLGCLTVFCQRRKSQKC